MHNLESFRLLYRSYIMVALSIFCGLPNNTHNDLVICLSECKFLTYILRQFRFINSCLKSDCFILNCFTIAWCFYSTNVFTSRSKCLSMQCTPWNKLRLLLIPPLNWSYLLVLRPMCSEMLARLHEHLLLCVGHLTLSSPGLPREEIKLLILTFVLRYVFGLSVCKINNNNNNSNNNRQTLINAYRVVHLA